MSSAEDARFMAVALALGRRGLGRAWPNPAVGAVIVKDGVIVGRGWTQPGGRPHAETEALVRAGSAAGGATLYVTLEPCAMCVGAISLARIARLVFAADDAKGGAVLHGPEFFAQPTCHHRPQIVRAGDAEAAGALLRRFFQARRPRLISSEEA